ncbi:succinate dehydrogenase cytochrome b subunit [Desulfatirhabdium butyrativorans]|uniref:succinate dehydrogenase cytochrome b subunit n=1 Tax=Desulfatirhabdium butyrativorans TaxID=340467 RepID=UPI00042873D4|nr:succinate dehydrogenase cytochrome b subunit [Desulfatirhabdium butyrativorans]
MNWMMQTLGSSIGKKLMMALSGLCFCAFLCAHLAGNLFIYGGKDSFNAYATHLHSLGPLLTVAEFGLLFLALVHVISGLVLFYQNFSARPQRYQVNASAGGRTIGSATMPYTGLVLLAFVLFHLFQFHFVDKTTRTIFEIVSTSFRNPVTVGCYVLVMIVAAIHVSHGFWSAFQTLGANHPKYMPAIRLLSILFSLIVGVGFGFIPVYVSLIA